jgi:hypothetical protein
MIGGNIERLHGRRPKVTEAAARDDRRLGAREVRIWAILIVAIAYWASIVRDPSVAGEGMVTGALSGVLENGAFDVFSWVLVFVRCWTARDDRSASWSSIASTIFLGAIVLVPVRLASAAALVGLGLVFTDAGAVRAVRRMGIVLFALAVETVWVTSPLAPLHVLLAGIDARVTAFLLRAVGHAAVPHGNVVEHLSANFSIEIWPYCSSSFPLAAVGLAFVVMVLYRGGTVRAAQFPWLALSWAASIVLTEIRLVLLAWNEAGYHWWHDGFGTTVYTLAALGLSVLFPILATAGPVADEGGGIVRSAA